MTKFRRRFLPNLLAVVIAGAVGAPFSGDAFATERFDVAAFDRAHILRAAATALGAGPFSIAHFPAPLSEGGANDFYSNGDYWWPDPDQPDGLPYIRRDGESNPGMFSAHRQALNAMRDAVAALAAAYRITGEAHYVDKAAELLRVFFLDPQTRMNPHLRFAQAIPGVTPGRDVGIIDALHLIEVPRAIEALQHSPDFDPQVTAGLKEWFRDLLAWMTTSANGRSEGNSENNHAVAYYLQLAVFADFVGDERTLTACRRRYKEVFLPAQMGLDGDFPLELARTKPYGYSIFQLDNMATLCQILSTGNDNLWEFELDDGRGIRRAMAFLYPFLADKESWPREPDIQAWHGWPVAQPSLLFAGLALEEPKYLELWQRLPRDPSDPEVRRNVAITQPVLWVER